jgi:hypothetical protein
VADECCFGSSLRDQQSDKDPSTGAIAQTATATV